MSGPKHEHHFSKQLFRSRISRLASYTEIYVSFLILLGIMILSFDLLRNIIDLAEGVIRGTNTVKIEYFLGIAFELVIGIEFVKMLAKHTPSSAVEVILYAIARQLINNHETMLDSLVGVIAIAILFAVRKYLSETIHKSSDDEYVMNGSITVDEFNDRSGSKIDRALGNTLAGVLYNSATKTNTVLEPGFTVETDTYVLEVYSMDANLIKQVKFVEKANKF